MLNTRFFNNPVLYTQKQVDLMNKFRELWSEHVVWTRFFILSTAFNLPDIEFVTNRLLQNPKDFANEFRKYYGNEKADEFERLLTEHLTIAASLVNNAKNGNIEAAKKDRINWYKNADEIAKFLASINPYWSEQEWKDFMYEHLRLTETEAGEILTGEYEKSIATFDKIEKEAQMMADNMSKGIIKQFKI